MSPPPSTLSSMIHTALLTLLLMVTSFVEPNQTLNREPKPNFKAPTLTPRKLSEHSLFSFSTTNGTVLIRGNATTTTTILSEKQTFQLGFFNLNNKPKWYLGIWYTSISAPTYVWVANRLNPTKNLNTSTLELTASGRLAVKESENVIVWESSNPDFSTEVRLLDNGNLVLLTLEGTVSWQSFDYPTDTWLPGMKLTRDRFLTSWRSESDPTLGFYTMRLKPPDYGEFELVYNGTKGYWSTGTWTGFMFSNVPEMTVPYIYNFEALDVYTPTASFSYAVKPLEIGSEPPLTRFRMDYLGRLEQYTWSPQTQNWNKFWTKPENECKVYGLCGSFSVCSDGKVSPCDCLSGFRPVAVDENEEYYFGGCRRQSDSLLCDENDGFEKVGFVSFNGADLQSFPSSRVLCEKSCLDTCSCVGFYYYERTNLCKILYGSLFNLRNLTSLSASDEDVWYVRVPRGGEVKKRKRLDTLVLAVGVFGLILISGLTVMLVFILVKRRKKSKGIDEDGSFPVTNLKVFSYKELHAVTWGFSERLGHGGFGSVFRGQLSDSTLIAVKRLERPGHGQKEFRAEVCTIGIIQHVNLVRLIGFCSEKSHRLLVYDYMPNGPLSFYLRLDGPKLSWDARFRIAVGTAKGIAYLHEECRDCIIHCDIKPENILLDNDFVAKVSDFGLAKLIARDISRVSATSWGTRGYIAPEWISGVEITTKADVYSYGMTLFELIRGCRNAEEPSSTGGEEWWFFPPWAAQQVIEGNIRAVVDKRLGEAYDIEEVKRVALVAVWCIQDDEAMRPTMGMVVKMLNGLVEVSIPPPPKLLQALVSGESFHWVRRAHDSGYDLSTGGGFFGDIMEMSSGSSESSLGNLSSPVNTKIRI